MRLRRCGWSTATGPSQAHALAVLCLPGRPHPCRAPGFLWLVNILVAAFEGALPFGPLQVFAPAFRRNARWSVESAVPDVGDESTPYQQVEAFYDFWFKFK
jgi:hypothetical protein